MLVMNFTIVDDQILTINNILNPDKLAYISQSPPPQTDVPAGS